VKKILGLLLLFPLTATAAEHGGTAVEKKGFFQQISEHAGEALEKIKPKADTASEHGGEAAKNKSEEHGDKTTEHDEVPKNKNTDEHAGTPVE
jgi:hypothetical protein